MFWGVPFMAQLVKNPPAMQKTWVQFLGLKDPGRQYYVSLNAEGGEFQLNAAGAAVVANMAKQAIQESSSKKLKKIVKKEK